MGNTASGDECGVERSRVDAGLQAHGGRQAHHNQPDGSGIGVARARVLPIFAPGPATHAGETSSPSRRRLNPQFVTWLMGWPPLGESGFAFSETEWSHYRQRQQSSLSGMRWKETGDDEAGLFSGATK